MRQPPSVGAGGHRPPRSIIGLAFALAASAAASAFQVSGAPDALSTVPVPLPANIDDIVVDRDLGIVLGKMLFWDMQTGSDGIQACASCHYHAGIDPRIKNQINPAADGFQATGSGGAGGPNYTLVASDFPTHRLLVPDDNASDVLFDTNDRVSSQGIHGQDFVSVTPGNPFDTGTVQDPDPFGFEVGGVNTRHVEPRQANSVINAVFAHRIFWDGRAANKFNGQNPFGETDPGAMVLVNNAPLAGPPDVQPVRILLENAATASQSVGPPGSSFEMSYAGRDFKDIGRKLLPANPLAQQLVHPDDGVLGPYSLDPLPGTGNPGPLSALTYLELVQQVFAPEYWDSPGFLDGEGYTQAEANFAFFFGIAIMLYESTLVSDQTRYDQWALAGKPADGGGILTAQEIEGLDVFLNRGGCFGCHAGPEFAGASLSQLGLPSEVGFEGLLERMPMENTFAEGGLRVESVAPPAMDPNEPPAPPHADTVYVNSDPRYKIIEIRLPQAPSAPVAWLYFTQAGTPGFVGPGGQPMDVTIPMIPGSAAPPTPNPLPACPSPAELFSAQIRFRTDLQARFRMDITMSWSLPGLPPGNYRVYIGGGFVGTMQLGMANECAVYDFGFYNIGVRPTEEDLGAGADGPFGPFSLTKRKQQGQDIGFDLDPPVDPNERAAVRGAFRAQQIRNIELTGPYMHNGGFSTLEQVVDFYTGGAHFLQQNIADLDPDVAGIGGMDAERKAALVAFMKALTDERVRIQSAPFDHPQLFVPNGHPGDENAVTDDGSGQATDDLLELAAVGATGDPGNPLLPFHEQLAGAIVALSQPNLETDEAGDASPRLLRVSLATPPTAAVTVELEASDPGELAFSPATLVFTPQNWFQQQLVTVTAIEDMRADGTQLVQVRSRPSVSTDANYAGRIMNDVTVRTRDSGHTWDRIDLEAEAGVLTAPMVAVNDGSASGGACILVPEGTGDAATPTSGGQARFDVTVPATSASTRFVLWAKVAVPNAASNGFWVRLDQGQYVPWNAFRAPGGGWAWDRVGELVLTPGTHTLRLHHREDGAGVDQLILTNDLRFTPRGAPLEPRNADAHEQSL